MVLHDRQDAIGRWVMRNDFLRELQVSCADTMVLRASLRLEMLPSGDEAE